MLNSATVLKYLDNAKLEYYASDYAKSSFLQQLRELCEKDIRETIVKNSGGTSMIKRYKSALKYIGTKDMLARPALCGTWIETFRGKECQTLCNGFTAVFLWNKIDGVPMVDHALDTIKVAKIITDRNDAEYQEVSVDLVEIKAVAKTVKSGARLAIGEQEFNPNAILDIVNMLGDNITFYQHQNGLLTHMYLENENGVGIVLPLRK